MSNALERVVFRARRSPFYKDRLQSVTTFESVRITTKEDLRAGYPFAFLSSEKSKIASYHESSGTEGKPIASYFSNNDWTDITTRFLRNGVNLRKEDTFFIKTPYSMVTTAHQAQRAGELVGSLIVPGDNRTTNMPYSRVVQLLKDLEVTVTWSLPNEVALWAMAAEANGLDPKTDFPHLRAFWVAGESLSPGRKKLLSQLWGGKPIYEDYGSTETGSLAGECEAGNLHAWSDRVQFEIYDLANKQTSAYGRGQLLVTPFFREAMPIIRYLIEDEVAVTVSDCKCGSVFPTIEVFGRSSSRLSINDRYFYPKEIENVVCKAGLSFGMSLWSADYGQSDLEVKFYAREKQSECADHIKAALRDDLGITATATSCEISAFLDPIVFKAKLDFSKPVYISRRNPC